MGDKIEKISTVTVESTPDLYKIVDALNRSLKYDDLMFGLALDENHENKMIFSIYRT
ncbi:YpmA family protein [Alteribacillus sp. HJP-4]|uniref:YpmA family protein n=1 Tax=Alteribacillus sp. HJP-4 TaxID=2775394 RepID=UPI0035CD0DA8